MGRFVVTCIALQELLIEDRDSEEAQALLDEERLPCDGSLLPYFYCGECAYVDEREKDDEE